VKKFLRSWVDEIKLAPERLEVDITYKVPEPFVNNLVAGACYVIIHKTLKEALAWWWLLPRKSRRLDLIQG